LGWSDLLGGMYASRSEKGDEVLQRRMKDMFAAYWYDEKSIPVRHEMTNVRGIFSGEL
jgi:hypothetical protein